jgi:hypothetical protein
MDLYEIFIPKDNDWNIMDKLGRFGQLQFVDLNRNAVSHTLTYINPLKRVEQTERQIR